MFEVNEELYQAGGLAVPAEVTAHGIVARQIANAVLSDQSVQRLIEQQLRQRVAREVSARLIDALPEGYALSDVAYLAALIEELIEQPAPAGTGPDPARD